MRRNLITMLLCLLTAVSFAQKEKFLEPDIKAEFPDGVAAMMQFVRDNMKYPKDCEKEGICGRVVAAFVVETDGSLSNLEVLQSPDERLSKEVVRIIGLMPKWRPAIRDDKPIKMKYTMPVSFNLPKRGTMEAWPVEMWSCVNPKIEGAKEDPKGLYKLVKFAYEDGSKRDVPFEQYKYCGDSITLQLVEKKNTNNDYWMDIYDNDGYEFKYSASLNEHNTQIYDSNDKGFKFKWYSNYTNKPLFPYHQYVTEMYSSEYSIPYSARHVIDLLKMKTATDRKIYGCWYRIGVVTQVEGLDMFLAAPAPQELYQVFDKDMYLQVYNLRPDGRIRAYCVLRPIVYKENDVIVQHGTEYKIDWVNDDVFKLNFDRGDGTIVTEVWKRSGLPRNYQRIFGTNVPTFKIVNPIPNYFRLETRQE